MEGVRECEREREGGEEAMGYRLQAVREVISRLGVSDGGSVSTFKIPSMANA